MERYVGLSDEEFLNKVQIDADKQDDYSKFGKVVMVEVRNFDHLMAMAREKERTRKELEREVLRTGSALDAAMLIRNAFSTIHQLFVSGQPVNMPVDFWKIPAVNEYEKLMQKSSSSRWGREGTIQ